MPKQKVWTLWKGSAAVGKVTGFMEAARRTPARRDKSNRVNLESHGLRPATSQFEQPTVILVVGSSMDSGKTTAASSVVHGLSRSNALVCAAKLTGTASLKDRLIMEDAGAAEVLDFTDVGHASTAMCTREQV